MSLPSWPSLLLLLALGAAIHRLRTIGRRPPGCPPGPPTLPLLGNLHLMRKDRPWLQFQQWAEEYGFVVLIRTVHVLVYTQSSDQISPVYSLVLGTRVVIVLSTDQAVRDLLDKKGSIYSSRPESYIVDLLTGGLSFAMMKYDSTWKLCHRIFQSSLTSRAAKSYQPYQDVENKQLLRALLDRPANHREHLRRYTYSLSTQITLGSRTVTNDDPKLVELYSSFEEWSELMGQSLSVLVDLYPALQWLPNVLLSARSHAERIHNRHKQLFLGHWLSIKAKIRTGTAPPCIAHDINKYQEQEKFSDDLAAYICGFLLIAGSDTIATQLSVFLLAMVLYPEVQQAAQEEIDAVCGDRLPTHADASRLPYVRSIIKEMCRWLPAAILGIPHAVMEDDEYLRYRIPKGSVIITNVWAIHNDPNRHPNPRTFDPTRYAADTRSSRESALASYVRERDHFLFGSGRRLCVGMDIADSAMALGIATMLWAFRISKARDDATGEEVTPDAEDIVGGLAAYPRPFPASIVPRSEARAEVVREAWRAVEEGSLDAEGQWRETPVKLR